jgi:hypothetical protein
VRGWITFVPAMQAVQQTRMDTWVSSIDELAVALKVAALYIDGLPLPKWGAKGTGSYFGNLVRGSPVPARN